jgi:hypothetical protein
MNEQELELFDKLIVALAPNVDFRNQTPEPAAELVCQFAKSLIYERAKIAKRYQLKP